ncbi:CAP domain-containing protein [Litoreibacter albidus]|uniref:CAP domain-containing protein n=1 Tax=Litoreibacter albidus TaxID=670155 RepID=UPI003736B8FD
MKRSILAAIMGAGFLAACGPDEPVTVPFEAVGGATSQMDVGALLNAARAANGLAPLRASAKLTAAARAHAQDMARTGGFSHVGSDRSRPSDRVRAQGYGYCYVAENIAKGQETPERVMQSWMSSAGHRKNNLSPKAAEYGVARAAGDYWVLVFGRSGC